jgi:hypothetical protein
MPFAIPFANRVSVLLEHAPAARDTRSAVAPPEVRAAVANALDRGETHYTDRPGILPLREKIARSLAERFHIVADPKADLIVTCGVTEARFVAVQQLLVPGDTLMAPLASDRLVGATVLRRASLVGTPQADIKLIYLTSATPEAELRLLLTAIPEQTLILYEVDDAENRFHPAQIATFAHRTMTIGDLGAESWRVGYLASPATFSAPLRDFKQALTICSTNLSQWAAMAITEAQ